MMMRDDDCVDISYGCTDDEREGWREADRESREWTYH